MAGKTAESPEVLKSASMSSADCSTQLEDAGVASDDLSTLEWFYLPLLAHERMPRALHQRLAHHLSSSPTWSATCTSPTHQLTSRLPRGEVPEDDYQFSDACWQLMRNWREPSWRRLRNGPGCRPDGCVDCEGSRRARQSATGLASHRWLSETRSLVARPTKTASGRASPCGRSSSASRTPTWDQLAITRMNQRGSRSAALPTAAGRSGSWPRGVPRLGGSGA